MSGNKKIMTKFYLFSAVLLCTATTLFAQFNPGQKVLGGNVTFAANKTGNEQFPVPVTKYRYLVVNPSYGWFVKEDVLWSAGFSYNLNRQKIDRIAGVEKNTYQNFSLNVARQKFIQAIPKLFVTITTAAAIFYGVNDREELNNVGTFNSKITTVGAVVNVGPGITYQLNSRFLLDAYFNNLVNIGYSHNFIKNATSGSSSTGGSFNFSSGLTGTNLGNIALGFRWLIPRKG